MGSGRAQPDSKRALRFGFEEREKVKRQRWGAEVRKEGPAARGSEEQGGRKGSQFLTASGLQQGLVGAGAGVRVAGSIGIAHTGQDSNARRGATELKGHYARKITLLPRTITPPGYWKTREPREGLR